MVFDKLRRRMGIPTRLDAASVWDRPIRDMAVDSLRSHAEFQRYCDDAGEAHTRARAFEQGLVNGESGFTLPGWCSCCRETVAFEVDFKYAAPAKDGLRLPNWRERLVCPQCTLNNRMRALLHFMASPLGAKRDSAVYITEQTSQLYVRMKEVFPNTTGSEFLRDGTPSGHENARGIRHEDMTSLSFPDQSFDHIVTADVLEHVPDYSRALSECLRCLKPRGSILISVPFVASSESTIVRASLDAAGNITHHLPPEFHGDPLSAEGVLCYYHFGWDLLDRMRAIGFEDPALRLYWSEEFGYLGGGMLLITGRRPRRRLSLF